MKILKSEKGQSIVEFALLLPIFVLILFGTIEFSRLWETMNVLTSAAREGARVAAVTSPSSSQVGTAVRNVLQAGNVSASPMIRISGPNSAKEVRVTVTIAYRPVTGSIIPGLSSVNISRSTVMHWEG